MATKLILVADDQQGVRRLLGEMLDVDKYTLLEAGSGDEALEILERQHVDLVFLDVKMPNLDGVMTLRQMVQKPGCPPVIIITAQAQADLEKRVLSMGAKAYLEKPFDINIVLQLVEELT
ncbi:MAG: response regulator [Bacillota bacterium]